MPRRSCRNILCEISAPRWDNVLLSRRASSYSKHSADSGLFISTHQVIQAKDKKMIKHRFRVRLWDSRLIKLKNNQCKHFVWTDACTNKNLQMHQKKELKWKQTGGFRRLVSPPVGIWTDISFKLDILHIKNCFCRALRLFLDCFTNRKTLKGRFRVKSFICDMQCTRHKLYINMNI